ncbi:MAG TPA: FAD:protein FMN transferase, partial [Ilumatobacteraceae bacterium]|nr:FAD:protein FMN transferase [Ilumatobacteraceae bacterium]
RLGLRLDTIDPELAQHTARLVLAEADRLEAMLSTYRPNSVFSRWRRGEPANLPVEVVDVLELAARWHRRSSGLFNCCLGAVMARWSQAVADQVLPGRGEMAGLAAATTELPFAVVDGVVHRTGDCSVVDLHGVAKGWVVDRLVEVATAIDGVDTVVVDLGGDIAHRGRAGSTAARIAVENPWATAENASALSVVTVADAAIATSSGARRGWLVGGRWYGHLPDPITGWPIAERRSTTVVAATAADADALASAFGVATAEQREYLAERLNAAALVVDESGIVWRSAAWVDSIDERPA